MSLRVRFAAATAIAVAVVAVLLITTVYFAAAAQLRDQVDSSLNDRARAFVDTPQGGDRGNGGPGFDDDGGPPPERFGGASGAFQIVAPDGTASQPPGETAELPVDARTKEIAASGSGRSYRDATVDGVHLRVLTVGTGARGAVQVARPLTEVDDALSRLLGVAAVLGAIGVALAAVLGALVARTALAPIRRFTRRTEAIVDDPDLTHRLEVRGDDELARLAASFNEALGALEASVDAQRHLVADASHELRTPIASLRANIQILDEADKLPPDERVALRADIIAELDELTALVGDIVELARGSRPSEELDDVRLDLVVRSLVDRFERRAGGTVTFHADLDESLVRGDAERIVRAVSNLLDNALKWSPPGSTIDVTVRDGTVTVRDRGPGFGDEDLPHVFDRFYRASTARGTSGSGLGLAIVRQTAESHGGDVAAENAEGGGALLRLRLAPG